MSGKTKKILAVVILVVLIAAALVCWLVFKPAASAGSKAIVVEVIHGDGSTVSFDISTDEEYLRGAVEQEGLVAGTESEYGLYVLTVDGETADEAQEQWWCITRGGEMLMTGVDDTPIADGEKYEFTLTTGW